MAWTAREYADRAKERAYRPSYRGTVITIHGMNTRGAWQKRISTVFQDALVRYKAVDYGMFRGGVLTWGAQRKVADEIEEAVFEQQREVPDGPHGVIAHSFGTLCLGYALKSRPSLKLDRICLVGAILERNFPWEDIRQRQQVSSVLLEKGGADRWPRIAECWLSHRGAGASGREGFEHGDGLRP